MSEHRSWIKKWTLTNTLAFAIAYLIYTPVAHGITGGHEHYLTQPQLIAHSIALAIVGMIIFYGQKRALEPIIEVPTLRLITGTTGFIAMFWFGYYQTFLPEGPDYDIHFAYLVLGTALWIDKVPLKGNIPYLVIGILSFPVASFIGELILFILVMGFELPLDVRAGMLDHTIFWLAVGVTTGLIGGPITGWAITKTIKADTHEF